MLASYSRTYGVRTCQRNTAAGSVILLRFRARLRATKERMSMGEGLIAIFCVDAPPLSVTMLKVVETQFHRAIATSS